MSAAGHGGHHHHPGNQSGFQGRRNYNQGGGGHQRGRNPNRGGGNFGNSPYKPNNAVVPRTPINLITNNFKIQSQNNHSGIIYTYSVDFIDGENLETLPQMPLPPQTQELPAIEAEKPVSAAAATSAAAPQNTATTAAAASSAAAAAATTTTPVAAAAAGASAAATQSPKATVDNQNPEEEVKGQRPSPPQKSSPSVVRNFNVNNLETFQKYKILGSPAQAAKLKSIFVNYVCVGDNIFSTTAVDDKISFETKNFYFGRKFTILI